ALTRSAFLGTPHYMAPEQARGEEITPRTDQYALGIVLYEMLTGTPPYQADTPQAVVYQHIYSNLPLPHERNPNITEAMERVILKALAKDPADRYPDMQAFASAVQAATGEAVAAQAGAPSPGAVAPPATAEPPSGLARTPSPPRKPSGPSTERIDRSTVAAAVQAVEPSPSPGPAAEAGRRFRLGWPAIAGIAAVAILALGVAAFAVLRGGGASDAVVTLKAAGGSVPGLTVQRPDGSDVADVTSDEAQRGFHLHPGRYLFAFSGTGYNGSLPVTLGGGAQTVDLSRLMTFVSFTPAPDTTIQSLEARNPAGDFYITLASGSPTPEAIPPGSYLFDFQNSTYADYLPFRARPGAHAALNLGKLYSHVTILPPKGATLPDFYVRDARGNDLYQLKASQAELGVYMRPGHYALGLTSSNVYLDPAPVTVGGGSQVIDLSRVYGHLTVTPWPGRPLPTFDIKDSAGTNTIHYGVDTLQAGQGVYLQPGKYLLAPTDQAFLTPIPLIVKARHQASLALTALYGRLFVIAPPKDPLSSAEIDDAHGKVIQTLYSADAHHPVFLRPGLYIVRPSATSSASATYQDPASFRLKAGVTRLLRLRDVYARLRVPSQAGSSSLSYSWRDGVGGGMVNVSAQATPQFLYVTPGDYQVEVGDGTTNRVVTVHAPAGTTTALPR
ncbi:MAG: protein kinase, partial [Chloroflexi bacterium]|nr:protein kinase [Chloroflexota bacterium]